MPLSTLDPNEPYQLEYQPVVADLKKCLVSGVGSNLHSLYIYGSVAQKCAKPNQSNIDVIVITHRPVDENWSTIFNTIKWRFQKEFPFITEVSLKKALAHEVASLESLFSWGFMLKHLSVCIHGEDLSECFGEYVPSWEIAKYWNMDIEEWLTLYRQRIVTTENKEALVKVQQAIAKKLLRASYTLVMHKDKQWFDDPQLCGQHFLNYHPDKKVDIERLGILLSGRLIAKRSVVGILDSYGSWLVKQYKKTEFKIG
ncbi:nucleotidyltransferase domain-containing protein [Vibrio sp. S4M6]|uniref:nucleotidyltransferase domain-containing protein n=1 Tax=Vibrio sinus TaxID=2946865 RepID=UPI002029D68B|nr:nucleotidyltransferase domain-containing protein [Vibrio sinus]MCL9783405.1 nucleotidyltransferase domain-containing protein [Vibrio sinus]